MKAISIFVIVTVLLLTIFSSAIRPGLHKQFILTNSNFKMEGLSQRPTDLQSVQMFKIGEAPVNITAVETPAIPAKTETPIIPSDINIIPSDFVQTVPVNGQAPQTQQQQPANNSDKVLEQVDKMLNAELPAQTAPAKPKEQPKAEPPQNNSTGCSICDQLKNPKVRAELIAWNRWRSELQNEIMRRSSVEAPYGTMFFFSFKVDNNRRITNIKVISTRPNTDNDIKNITSVIIGLNSNSILTFPQNTNRKSVSVTGGFLMSDYEEFSTPSDFRDFEYVQH